MIAKRSLLASALVAAAGFAADGAGLAVDALLGASPAVAQDEEKKGPTGKEVPSLRQAIYKEIAEAQEQIEKGNAEEKKEGVEQLRELREDEDLNAYERGIVEQIFAQIAIDNDDYGEAINRFEAIVSLEKIPKSLYINSLQALGQLYLSQEQYEKSVERIKEWLTFQENPGPQPYIWLAQAHYGQDNYEKILENTDTAIQLARQRGIPAKENWYLLKRLAHFNLNQIEKVTEVLEVLALNWDKPEYWKQLGAAYSELGKQEEQLAANEIAYRRGFLDSENDLTNLAQLYMYHSVPIKAAWVLEDAMQNGTVEKDGENYATLGQAYLNAQELEKAEDPLREAAEKQDTGDLWMRLGQVHVEREQWQEAIEPLQNALNAEEKLDQPGFAHMLLGQAYFNTEQFGKAKERFKTAQEFDETENNAEQWLSYTEKEVQRREELSEYYGDSGSSGGSE